MFSVSFDHSRAPFALLESLTRGGEEIARAVAEPSLSDGSVVLSTCNRFEVYLEMPADRGANGDAGDEAVLARIAGSLEPMGEGSHRAGHRAAELRSFASIRTDHQAVEHLFAVTAGLESVVLGEEEIAGQVRRAHAQARSRGTVTHHLERLFQAAARTGREVTQRTEMRTAGRSLVRFALDLAEGRLSPWARTPVLLIGTGAYAGAAVAALRERGVRDVRVYSSSGRAEDYAAARGLEAVPRGGLSAALSGSELVIACSRVDEPLLGVDLFDADAPVAAGVSGPQLLIDLGMPRNIDPAVAELPGVELLDLQTMASIEQAPEFDARAAAERIVRESAEEFSAAQAERDALPALLAMREHVLALLEDEVGRTRRRPGAGTRSGAADDGVELALRHFAGRLLHDPMTRIRALGREGQAEQASAAVAALFGR